MICNCAVVRVATFVTLVTRVTAVSKSVSKDPMVILVTMTTRAVMRSDTLVEVPVVKDPDFTLSITVMTEVMLVSTFWVDSNSAS